jgi:hypothetical protein
MTLEETKEQLKGLKVETEGKKKQLQAEN